MYTTTLEKGSNVSAMEVETWPPLADGNLGIRGRHGSSPDLGLAIADDDIILTDDERELLQSPVRDEDQTTCVKDALVNGDKCRATQEKTPALGISGECNGDIASETVSDAARVFRTEKNSGTVRTTELSDEHSSSAPEKNEDGTQNGLNEDSDAKEDGIRRKLSVSEPCEDVIVEDPCSLDTSELHSTDEQGVEDSTEDGLLGTTSAEESSHTKEECADELLDSGLSPKSLKDFGDDLDDMEIPQVIDISSIGVEQETKDEPTGLVSSMDATSVSQSGKEEDYEIGVDDEEIPQVIDVSSICVGKDDASNGVEAAAEVSSHDETEVGNIVGDDAEIPETTQDSESVGPDEKEKSETEAVDIVSVAPQKDIPSPSAEDSGIGSTEDGVNENSMSSMCKDTASGDSTEQASEKDANTVTDSAKEVPVVGEEADGVEKDSATTGADEGNEDNTLAEEETPADDSVDFEGGDDGSPDYQGMTDDILPIIESELDDMPVGEGNIFDTEVECDDGTSLLEDLEEDNDDEGSCTIPPEIEVDVESPRVLEGCKTLEKGQEECSSKKDLDSQFSLSDRAKLKRRGSADNAATPPPKVMKRQSSLDDLTESAGKSDTLKSLEEFKKLSTKKLPATAENIASEPSDVPLGVEESQKESSPVPAKRRKTVDSEPEVGASSSSTESGQPAKKDESLLVIDLDDDDEDEKPAPVEPPSDKESPTIEQAEPSSNGPKSAMDILFNGKKEITLNRKMFTRVMKSYVSQYLLTFSELGKATTLSLKANDVLNKIQSSVSNYEKQKDDFKSIMNKLIEDRQARKTWDENLVPPKATRSVGLQVCSVGTMYVTNVSDAEDSSALNRNKAKTNYSSNNQSQALAQQKLAYAQQQMAMAKARSKQAEQQLNSIGSRPIAKKSVTPTNRPNPIKTVPVAKPVVPVKPKPNGPQLPTPTPKLNGLKAVTVTRNPEPAPSPNNTPLTVTTVSPNSRTFTLSNKGTFALKSPPKASPGPMFKQNAGSMLSKALTNSGMSSRPVNIAPKTSPQNAFKAVPVAVPLTPGTVQTPKNLASGPGRPGKPPAPAKKPESAVPDTTIDLTDDDGPPPSRPSVTPRENSTARKSTAPSRVSVPAKAPVAGKPMRHPALPPNPPGFNAASAPPRPYLGICDTQTVTQGIMLTWHFNNVVPLRKISKFQVFAYQESKGDGEDAWKKVGDVDALPLPMACTLTQFREGYTYHFIVRALDEGGHVGPFSAPNTITLMKKTA